MSESWVINASPIILLAKVGLMQLVPSLAETFVIPRPVVEEILSVRGDAATRWVGEAGKQFIRPPVLELMELSHEALRGAGEQS